jgi:lipoprotein signal peptidase
VELTQLLGLGVAWSFATSSTWVAAVLAALAIATLVCVFLPASTAALTSRPS